MKYAYLWEWCAFFLFFSRAPEFSTKNLHMNRVHKNYVSDVERDEKLWREWVNQVCGSVIATAMRMSPSHIFCKYLTFCLSCTIVTIDRHQYYSLVWIKNKHKTLTKFGIDRNWNILRLLQMVSTFKVDLAPNSILKLWHCIELAH